MKNLKKYLVIIGAVTLSIVFIISMGAILVCWSRTPLFDLFFMGLFGTLALIVIAVIVGAIITAFKS